MAIITKLLWYASEHKRLGTPTGSSANGLVRLWKRDGQRWNGMGKERNDTQEPLLLVILLFLVVIVVWKLFSR